MKNVLGTLLAISALAIAAPSPASNCAGTSTGRIPLTDLGAGFYLGVQGGLYPGGTNIRPAAHDSAGMAIANAIVPLDTLGVPDATNGRVVVISIGMSNCTQEWSAFIPKGNADPLKRANVKLIDCAVGGQSANVIDDPAVPYWDSVTARLRRSGSANAQAQVVWIKEADSSPTGTFATSSESLHVHLVRIVRIIHAKLPNVKLLYLTSRIYAGYATSTLNPEPYAYESGFAVKQLVADQIGGAAGLNFDPARGPVAAPWLSWGPYLWADGLTARSDGLTWDCSEFSSTDGTHPSTTGRAKVADSLAAFFRRDATTAPWYVVQSTVGVGPETSRAAVLIAAPNPARGAIDFSVQGTAGGWSLRVLDSQGRAVRKLSRGAEGSARIRWDLRDDAGARVPAGVYFAQLARRDGVFTSRVTVSP